MIAVPPQRGEARRGHTTERPYLISAPPARNRAIRWARRSRSRIWHSQRIRTFHPARRSCASVRRSRAALPARLASEYAAFFTGETQPWTVDDLAQTRRKD